MRTTFCCTLLFAVGIGCSGERRSESPPPQGSANTGGIPIATLVGDCPVDSTARHWDPVDLVEEFVRRDAEGPFEREDEARRWYASALTCVERATSDHYEVIRTFRIEAGPRSRDTAFVYVTRERRFSRAADATGRPRLTQDQRTWTDTVLAVRTSIGWRIHDIHGGAHRLPGVARTELRGLSTHDTRLLEGVASPPGG